MAPSHDLETMASELLTSKGLRLVSCTSIQTLWAGYGNIARVTAASATTFGSNCSADPQLYILKYICPPPPPVKSKPKRKSATDIVDEGHIRKILSYQIEQSFYIHLAPQIPKEIAVASCLAFSHSGDSTSTAMLMTDLCTSFSVAGEKMDGLTQMQVHAALDWLGKFHGFWWGKAREGEISKRDYILPPVEHIALHQSTVLRQDKGGGGVWLKGGYSHLATRRKEYSALKVDSGSEWSGKLCEPIKGDLGGRSIADLVDAFLCPDDGLVSSSPYQTLIHGGVKSENLFTTNDGSQAAFYDFQYVGLGLGVSDLAKLFTVSIPLRMLVENEENVNGVEKLKISQGEKMLLGSYLQEVNRRSGREYGWDVFVRHWETALVDWLRFQASWGFWGNTEWLEARVRCILADKEWLGWLKHAVRPKRKKNGTEQKRSDAENGSAALTPDSRVIEVFDRLGCMDRACS